MTLAVKVALNPNTTNQPIFPSLLFNSLTNDKFLDRSKLKAFADDKLNLAEKIEICFGKGRKHCGKRRKCWLPAFSPFPTVFSEGFYFRDVKSRDCMVKC